MTYASLAGAPSVVVDGSPAPGTVLCLSHWPGIGSPSEFAADLSAQMAFRYLGAFDGHGPARAASNNHFDQDGLVGLFALVAPDDALARRGELIEVARAGDFAVTSSRSAARLSMVLSAFADPERSPLGPLPDEYDDMTALLYTDLLGRLGELCDRPDRYRELWCEEDARLRASENALASGTVTITEIADVDLAIVRVPEDAPQGGGHRFAGQWVSGLHPMAINGATERGAVLTLRGNRYELVYRYESWVHFRSRVVRPRVDLTPLAERLNAGETEAGGPARWVAGSVSGLTPTLSPAGGEESALSPDSVVAAVEAHLRLAAPAWDPFRITALIRGAADEVPHGLSPVPEHPGGHRLPSRPMLLLNPRRRTLALVALAAAGALGLAACSSSPSTSSSVAKVSYNTGSGPDATTTTTNAAGQTTTIGTIPAADLSPAGTAGQAPTVTVPGGAPPSGLESADLIVGNGREAAPGDQVTVQYVLATYSAKKVIQSSWTSQPFTFTLGEGQVIPGWDQGVPGMHEGGRRELIIPPSLGYGAKPPQGAQGIAANDTLVFVIDLLKVD